MGECGPCRTRVETGCSGDRLTGQLPFGKPCCNNVLLGTVYARTLPDRIGLLVARFLVNQPHFEQSVWVEHRCSPTLRASRVIQRLDLYCNRLARPLGVSYECPDVGAARND